jgi:hypothetical protein
LSTFNNSTVLVRRLDVTARRTDQVVDLSERPEGGVLLETLIGRYVLDRDARVIWLLINGRRDMDQLVDDLAAELGRRAEEVRQPLLDLCEQLLGLGLLEVATPADLAALGQPAVCG